MEKNISYQDYIKLENEFKKKEKSMEERLWIDSNVGLFDNELRSNYNKPLEEFSEVIIEYLAKLTNAYQGVLYILSQDDKVLEAVAGYACSVEKLEKQEYEFGEGLVGQAAASKQEIIFEDLPPQNENNVIGEVQLHPKAVIIIPLLFNESVYGILKLVYLKSVDEKFKHLLTRTSQNIGAMLESILNSSKLQSLLKDSQEQTEKLLSQEEELRQNLEEMEATREAQEQAQNELEKLKNNLEKEVAQQTLKLEESIQKFDLATATTTEGIWDLVMPEDLQTNDDTYFWWSDNFRKMLGYKNEEDFPNRLASWSDLLHPDHKERTLEAFSAHLMDYSGNTPYNVEYQLLRKTGEYRWYRAVGNTLRDDSGKPLRVAGSLIDIQEAKDLEVVRKEQIQKFDLVTETTIEGLWDIIIPSDLQMDDNSAVWWSDRFRSMLGYENDEELPKVMSSWTNAIHPDQKEAVLEAFGAHLMDFTGNTPYDSEFKMLRKTGEYRWYRAIGNTLRDKDGKPLRIAGSMIDIQENKELEAVRKELVERFDLAANTATEGLWDMTMPDDLQTDDDTYFWWSDVFRQMLGYKDEEDFPNKLGSWSNLLHTDHKQKTLDAFAAHLMDFTGNTPYDVEYQLLRKTGEYRWYRAVGNTLRDESGKPLRVAGTLIDIQESKDLNQIQERFDLAIETSKEALWFIEFPEDLELKDDTPFWWADSFRKMLGYENETEFPNIFSSWTSKIHPDDKEAAFKAVSDHLMDLSGNTPYDEEYRLKHKSGKYIWFRSIGKTIRDKDGKPIKTGGTMIDIQHLKDLEENRKNYEVFASVLKEGLWSTRLNGNSELKPDLEINWSPQCHQLFGFESYDEFPNRFDSWSSRIHRSDKKETLSKLQAFFNNPDQDTLSELTHRLKSKSGKYEPYNMEVVKQKDGNYTKIVGSISRLPA